PETRNVRHPAEDSFQRAIQARASARTPDQEKQAFELLRVAASARHPEAQYRLADAYEHALGVPANVPSALQWYAIAATNRHAGAIEKLRAGLPMDFSESHHSYSIVDGKPTNTFWEIKPGFVRLRDGWLRRRAEFLGTLKTYNE